VSVFRTLAVRCPGCGNVEQHSVAESINAASRPELRQQIIDDSFQRYTCARCETRVVVDGPLLVIDFPRRQWFELYPVPWEAAWRELEADSERRFRQTMVELAPPVIQDQADEFTVRTVFGLFALREKLVAFDAGIDDRALEALKLELLRTEAELLGSPEVRLRLRTISADVLQFSVHRHDRWSSDFEVARSHLDTAAAEAFAAARTTVSAGSYVDIGRILVSGTARNPR
jgi:hypothetical protein